MPLTFGAHIAKYGSPVVIPGTFRMGTGLVGEVCFECKGAGLLPGSQIFGSNDLNICGRCNGFGRLMTRHEEAELIAAWLLEDDRYGSS